MIPINCLENQVCGLESSVRKFPGFTYNNYPVGSEVLPFIYLVLLINQFSKPILFLWNSQPSVGPVSQKAMSWSILSSPASSASFHCLLAPLLNPGHPRIRFPDPNRYP